MDPVTSTGCTGVDIGVSAGLEFGGWVLLAASAFVLREKILEFFSTFLANDLQHYCRQWP